MTDEKKIYTFWEKAGLFKADIKSSKKTFSLLIPPPNLTGELHIGHAMQHSILDAVARFKRLQGFDVLLLPGVDHAGIAFENTFDKELKKQNLSKEKLGREKWLETAWEFKEKIYNSVSKSFRFMGLSADWSQEVFSLDEKRKWQSVISLKNIMMTDSSIKAPTLSSGVRNAIRRLKTWKWNMRRRKRNFIT